MTSAQLVAHRLCAKLCLLALFSICISCSQVQQDKKKFVLPMLVNHPVPAFQSAYRLAVEDVNNSSLILPDRELDIDLFFSLSVPEIIAKMLDFIDQEHTIISGNEYSGFVAHTGIMGDVYGVAQISSLAISTSFSNKRNYPHVSRITTPSDGEIRAIMSMLENFSNIQGPGWTDVAIFALGSEYGINQATNFIELSQDTKFEVLTYQTYIEFQKEFDVEMREIKNSGVRVILSFVFDTDWPQIISAADSFGLVGENFVWVASDDLFGVEFDNVCDLTGGLLAPSQFIPQTKEYESFLIRWLELDTEQYPGSGVVPGTFTLQAYDALFLAARAIDILDRTGELEREGRIPAELWSNTIRNIKFDGVTGFVQLEPNGDRVADVGIGYYNRNDGTWNSAFSWTEAEGLSEIDDIVWFSGTTDIPDLDIRKPFHYWSCEEKERKFDPTGKQISIHTPDGSNIDEIDSHYHCDNFIDCKNFSDESVDCTENYLALFIVFGIITGILICICIGLLLFVIVFGIFLRYQRLRVASPIFLVIILVSIILGFFSIFAWFGKPHPVACAFQPWLLGLSSISMISSLCTKTFRIWRIFGGEAFKKQKITDIEMLALWCGCMIPAVFILTIWTIVSTPTAAMKDVRGEEHFVCTTGGFTGEPGGYIFFGILGSYGALVLLVGAFLSIVTRKVPTLFNESKLLAISIYNLGFLCIVLIPVFLVLQSFNPFIGWIVRTAAVLYAFTATMVLQFAPIVTRVVFINRFKNINMQSKLTSTTGHTRDTNPEN